MQLAYRGVRYQRPSQNLGISVPTVSGMYRGVPWQRRSPKSALVPEAIASLKYRGVSYSHMVWGEPPFQSSASRRVPTRTP
ncbi:MAG: DUF4278 domain-containing protein [Cyanophyceae cyanobacterium]